MGDDVLVYDKNARLTNMYEFSRSNLESFLAHLKKHAPKDAERRLKLLGVVGPTIRRPQMIIEKGKRLLHISKYEAHKGFKEFYFLAITSLDGRRLISAMPTRDLAYLGKLIKEADLIHYFTGPRSKALEYADGLPDEYYAYKLLTNPNFDAWEAMGKQDKDMRRFFEGGGRPELAKRSAINKLKERYILSHLKLKPLNQMVADLVETELKKNNDIKDRWKVLFEGLLKSQMEVDFIEGIHREALEELGLNNWIKKIDMELKELNKEIYERIPQNMKIAIDIRWKEALKEAESAGRLTEKDGEVWAHFLRWSEGEKWVTLDETFGDGHKGGFVIETLSWAMQIPELIGGYLINRNKIDIKDPTLSKLLKYYYKRNKRWIEEAGFFEPRPPGSKLNYTNKYPPKGPPAKPTPTATAHTPPPPDETPPAKPTPEESAKNVLRMIQDFRSWERTYKKSGEGSYKGVIKNAFYRDDLGFIDLRWGEAYRNEKGEIVGSGLAKILEKHGDDFAYFDGDFKEAKIANGLSKIIREGTAKIDKNRAFIFYEDFKAVVTLDFYQNQGGKWILTSYKLEGVPRQTYQHQAQLNNAPLSPSRGNDAANSVADKRARKIKDIGKNFIDLQIAPTQEVKTFLKKQLENVLNKELKNSEGFQAKLTLGSLSKMTSDKAVKKSVDNGFTRADHLEAVEKIEDIFTKSKLENTSEDLKNKDKNVLIHRLRSSLENADALLTVKESRDKNLRRIYTIELELIPALKAKNPPTQILDRQGTSNSLQASGGEGRAPIARDLDDDSAKKINKDSPTATAHTPPPPEAKPLTGSERLAKKREERAAMEEDARDFIKRRWEIFLRAGASQDDIDKINAPIEAPSGFKSLKNVAFEWKDEYKNLIKYLSEVEGEKINHFSHSSFVLSKELGKLFKRGGTYTNRTTEGLLKIDLKTKELKRKKDYYEEVFFEPLFVKTLESPDLYGSKIDKDGELLADIFYKKFSFYDFVNAGLNSRLEGLAVIYRNKEKGKTLAEIEANFIFSKTPVDTNNFLLFERSDLAFNKAMRLERKAAKNKIVITN